MRLVGRDRFVGRSVFLWMDGYFCLGQGAEEAGRGALLSGPFPTPPVPLQAGQCGWALPWGSMVLAKQLFVVGFAGVQTWGLDPSSALCVCVCPELSGFGFFFSAMANIISYLKGTH